MAIIVLGGTLYAVGDEFTVATADIGGGDASTATFQVTGVDAGTGAATTVALDGAETQRVIIYFLELLPLRMELAQVELLIFPQTMMVQFQALPSTASVTITGSGKR